MSINFKLIRFSADSIMLKHESNLLFLWGMRKNDKTVYKGFMVHKFILHALLCFPFILQAQDIQKEKSKHFHYYDFNIVINCNNFLKEEGYVFFIKNCDLYNVPTDIFENDSLRKNTIYFIKYKYRVHESFLPIDTNQFKLTNNQLDSIFDYTKMLFDLDRIDNLTKINPNNFSVLVPNDGYSGYVVFDLCKRGDRYRIDLKNTDIIDTNNLNFKRLLGYLLHITKVQIP
ncbi:MAG: hypothetical protein V2A54_17195 [Bacteroidota bacterium]